MDFVIKGLVACKSNGPLFIAVGTVVTHRLHVIDSRLTA